MPKILITVPVYNEEKHIENVLSKIIQHCNSCNVLVIDDGSLDKSAELISQFPVHKIFNEKNRGKARVQKHSINFAKNNDFEWILFIDGDEQHDPSFIPDFLEEIASGYYDIILGNRQNRHPDMPIQRQLSNFITSFIISLLVGQKIFDSQCGFRALRLDKVDTTCCKTSGFQFESELLLRMGKADCMISHVPISTIYGKESSSINVFSDTFKFIKLVITSLFWK